MDRHFLHSIIQKEQRTIFMHYKKSYIYGFINSLEKEFCLLFKMQKSLLKQIKVIILVIWE